MTPRIGRLLRRFRAGDQRSVLTPLESDRRIEMASPAFPDGGRMPPSTLGRGVGANRSPELKWRGVPTDAAALALFIEDVDVPLPRPLIHTVAVLKPEITRLAEDALRQPDTGVALIKTVLGTGYAGPRPIPGHGAHRYRFWIFALTEPVPHDLTVRRLLTFMRGRVAASGVLTGVAQR